MDRQYELNDRILEFVNSKNMNLSQFSREISEMNSGKITRIKDHLNLPNGEFLCKIKNRFMDLNMNWLFTGEGEMCVYESTGCSVKEMEELERNYKTVLEALANLNRYVSKLE